MWRHLATPAAAAESEIAKLTTWLLCTLDTAKEQPNMRANWVKTAACGWMMCCQIKYNYILSNDLATISSALQYQAVVYSGKHRTKGIETGWSLSTINVVFCPESMALEDSKIWSRQIALESVRVSAASYHIVQRSAKHSVWIRQGALQIGMTTPVCVFYPWVAWVPLSALKYNRCRNCGIGVHGSSWVSCRTPISPSLWGCVWMWTLMASFVAKTLLISCDAGGRHTRCTQLLIIVVTARYCTGKIRVFLLIVVFSMIWRWYRMFMNVHLFCFAKVAMRPGKRVVVVLLQLCLVQMAQPD